MDNTHKYLHIEHNGKSVYKIVDEIMVEYNSPLFAVKRIKEIFPFLSLMEAKEIVTISTSEYKSLDDYQESLIPYLDELDRIINEENESKNF